MKRKRYTDEEIASLTPRSLGTWMGQGLGLLRIEGEISRRKHEETQCADYSEF